MQPELTSNLHLLTPEFALAALAFLVFTVDLFLPEERKEWLAGLAAAGLLSVIALAILMRPADSVALYGGLVVVDGFGLFFKVFSAPSAWASSPCRSTTGGRDCNAGGSSTGCCCSAYSG